MVKSAIIFLAILIFGGAVMALPLPKIMSHIVNVRRFRTESSKIQLREFEKTAIDKYRKDPAFDYAEHKTDITWWDRFWQWIWDIWTSFWNWVAYILQKIFGSINAGRHAASVFRIIIIALAVAAIIYAIFRLAGIDLLKLFRKNEAIIEVPYSESLENIHQINFDEAIENALSVKDYRLAVRLLYLRTLKQLSDANLIKWQIEKTNTAYLNELTDAEQRRKFSIVTRQFEYVWYGNFPLDGQSFQNISNYFQDFKQRI